MAIFHYSGWDDQHLLPYVIQLFQGFLGHLARILGENATLNDVLQTLNKHYGMVILFNALSKELYSLKLGVGRKCDQVCDQGPHTPVGVSQKDPTGAHRGYEAGSLL